MRKVGKIVYILVVIAFFAVSVPAYSQDQTGPTVSEKGFVHNFDFMWPGQQDGNFKVSLVGYHFYPWCFGRFCGPGFGVLWSVKPNIKNGSSLEFAVPFGVRVNSRDNNSRFDFYFNAAPTVGKGGLGVGVGLSVSPRPNKN